ncbi:MAG: sulfatase-like hydrolase/transferase [Clostridiales bacterium]|nr:sulfatase-like hydrolase/transferase [Clostridiales bacterium]
MKLLKLLFIPVSFIFLEITFHIYIHMQPDYLLVILPFAISMGFFFTFLTGFFTKRLHHILVCILTGLMSIVFCVELICRAVLKQYYQLFSVMSTAANNRLTDYKDAVLEGMLNNSIGILALLLPVIIVLIFGKKLKLTGGERSRAQIISSFLLAVAFHFVGVLVVYGPWTGDFTPKILYDTDTYVEDQVEQLGVITMLRLDLKHSLFGIPDNKNATFENTFTKIEEVNFDDISRQDTLAEEVTVETQEAQSGTIENITDVIDTSPNILEIDFDTLIANSANDSVLWLNQYFQSQEPTKKNEYTGMFDGYNVIFITMEGFSKYLIDPVRTPTLYKMANEGFVFENYYTPLHYTSTSGGEFQNLVGLYPKNGNPISMKETGVLGTNLYFSLANQLNKKGYYSIGFHNNQDMYGRSLSHNNLGYEWNQGGEGFEMEKNENGNNVWPQSDLYMIEKCRKTYCTLSSMV